MKDLSLVSPDQVAFLGDVHSVQPAIRACRDIKEGSVVIQVGDLGVWDEPRVWHELDQLAEVCSRKSLRFMALRGNHDTNCGIWDNRQIGPVTLLADYTEKIIAGRRFLFVGGGYSVDRSARLKYGWPFCPNEPMIYRKTTPCDVLLTHSGPRRFLTELLTFPIDRYFAIDANLKDDLQREQDMVDDILRDCQPKVHVWGHFHVEKRDYEGGTIFQCLDVNQVKTLAEIES